MIGRSTNEGKPGAVAVREDAGNAKPSAAVAERRAARRRARARRDSAGGPGPAQARAAYCIGRLDRAVRQRLGEVTGRFGLTVAQYTALSVLEARGPLSNAQLARRSFVTPQAMSEIIAAMARKGMIAREPDERHGRIVRIILTRQGAQVLRLCDAAASRVEQQMLGALSREKRAMLLEMLRQCVAALEKPPATDRQGSRSAADR